MTFQVNEKSSAIFDSKSAPNKKNIKVQRPDINHLIKRILVERRKNLKQNRIIFVMMLFTVAIFAAFFLLD